MWFASYLSERTWASPQGGETSPPPPVVWLGDYPLQFWTICALVRPEWRLLAVGRGHIAKKFHQNSIPPPISLDCALLNGLKQTSRQRYLRFSQDINALLNMILASAHEDISHTHSPSGHRNVPWWNSECQRAVALRRRAMRALNTLP